MIPRRSSALSAAQPSVCALQHHLARRRVGLRRFPRAAAATSIGQGAGLRRPGLPAALAVGTIP